MNVAWLRGPIRRAYGLRAENYLPTTMAPLEGDLIRDLCCGKTLRQSFVAAPGLTRVDLVLRPTPRDHAHLGFTPRPATLVQVQQATEVLREVPLAPLSLTFKGYQRVKFEPIESSGTFDLILTAGPVQWGIGVGVSKSGAYPTGELFENDERIDGDLLFGLFYDD